MYIPTTTHVVPLATIRRERMLPQPGYVLVDEGERVEAQAVVAKAETYGKHYLYDLTRLLGVPADQVAKYLKAQPGVGLEKGEVLAMRSTLLGFSSATVRAPAKGTVIEIQNGEMLYAAAGPEIEIKAGFPGTVVAVNTDWGVRLETPGALIQAAWGNGRQEYGVLKMLVNDPTQPLAGELLDASCKGAIVVAGMTNERGLRQAEQRKVRGLILGSLSSGMVKAARSAPFPIVAVEGFGKRVMSQQAWSLFADHNTREASLDARPADRWEGRRPEIIIPLPHPGGTLGLPADGQGLAEGRRVRVNRQPYAGLVGTISTMPQRMAAVPSGVQAAVAHVDLEEQGTVVVPLANLELYE
jgi:hypothetical protein